MSDIETNQGVKRRPTGHMPLHPTKSNFSSAEWYAQKVVNYSRLDAGDEYLSGSHYTRLGKHLLSPYQRYDDDCSVSIDHQQFQTVSVCDMARKHDDPLRTCHFSQPEEFMKHMDGEQPFNADTASQAGLRDHGDIDDSAGSATEYSSTLDADPELFYRHLNVPVGLRLRRFILHNLHTFSIQQTISIEVINHTKIWSIVVLMDPGKDLSQCSSGPWLNGSASTNNTRLLPVFQHRSRMALYPASGTAQPSSARHQKPQAPDEEPSLPQSIGHIHQKYGRFLKTDIMAHDAFYALNELFEFSAASIDQLFELFEENVLALSQHADPANLSELLILHDQVDNYKSYVKETLEIVRARGGPTWPRANEPDHQRKAGRAASILQSRYERLLRRSERLSEQCSSRINITLNFRAQDQTEKAMKQADRLGKLSFLAYIYIPITFAASFYAGKAEKVSEEENEAQVLSMPSICAEPHFILAFCGRCKTSSGPLEHLKNMDNYQQPTPTTAPVGVSDIHNSSPTKTQPWMQQTSGIPQKATICGGTPDQVSDSTHGIPQGQWLIMGNAPIGLRPSLDV
ncbi:hypothetical protein J7T55_015246 [Diaporthe amygdali]|uniref:uncharacterized protein n=1 Tax=Phomopsis amygdali TaxID=1214568 RepID=UPI0022FE60BE|nr:uncharacterized protein J7T55_015246 [Diaporthe amygdali]KAJ0120517.1 hypothetical protein J7T55_015246 [Diaporthe amygdali]